MNWVIIFFKKYLGHLVSSSLQLSSLFKPYTSFWFLQELFFFATVSHFWTVTFFFSRQFHVFEQFAFFFSTVSHFWTTKVIFLRQFRFFDQSGCFFTTVSHFWTIGFVFLFRSLNWDSDLTQKLLFIRIRFIKNSNKIVTNSNHTIAHDL